MQRDTQAGQVRAAFREAFGREPEGVWAAPGRVNLIGEHTDYTGGLVLPFALPLRCWVAAGVATRDPAGSRVLSRQRRGPVSFDVEGVGPGRPAGWAGYVAGVLWALRQAGQQVPDLDLVLDSQVPEGAGLSSSAAVSCAVAVAVRDLAGLDLSDEDLITVAQRAENEVVGAPTGIMDQSAALLGRPSRLVYLDTRNRAVRLVLFDPAAHGLAVLVLDTRTAHSLADGQYAQRRAACERARSQLGVRALRDLTLSDLPGLSARLDDPHLVRRVRHVVTENARVEHVVAALEAGADPRHIGPLLTASHRSLRDDFQVSCPELDLAVQTALAAGAHGARMTGGGFGGSVIALVDQDRVAAVSQAVVSAFTEHGMGSPDCFPVVPAGGAERVG